MKIPEQVAGWGQGLRMGWFAAVAALALAGCGTTKPKPLSVDPVLNEVSTLAREAYLDGLLEEAVELYTEALQRAGVLDQTGALGTTAFNLALCHLALAQYEEAAIRAREARADLATAGADFSETWWLEASALYRLGQYEEAGALLDQALQSVDAATAARQVCDLYILRAEIACELRHTAEAHKYLEAATALFSKDHPPSLQGRWARANGHILLLEDIPAAAAIAFDEETEWLRSSKHYGEMAMALVRAGGAYMQAGFPAEAADRYFRAGRSLVGLGNAEGALKIAEKAATAAAEAGDPVLLARSERLLADIRSDAGD